MFTAPLLFKLKTPSRPELSPEESQDRSDKATPTGETLVQRKCAQCEEEEDASTEGESEEGMIQRKENTAAWSMQGLESNLQGERGGGFVLPAPTQNMMERGIGADFSQVRLHTGQKAVQMNRQLNSRAFTHGRDIYFNQGEYQPEAPSGQHLLAHELTHVVQQGATDSIPNIQRSGPSDGTFAVKNIESEDNQRSNFVYFDLDSDSLTAEEAAEVDAFVASNLNAPEIHLYGYASEEGRTGRNRVLIRERMQAVANRMLNQASAPSYTGTIHQHSRLDASEDSIQYRSYRSVEMSLGESVITETETTDTRDCNDTENDVIDAARDANIAMLSSSISGLQAYLREPATYENVELVLDNNFGSHSPQTVQTLLDILIDMLLALGSFSGNATRRCADEDYNSCLNAGALTSVGQTTFCASYFSPRSDRTNASYPDLPSLQRMILAHELGHYIDRRLPDRSYTSERVFRFLTTEQRLNNADSISVFLTELNDPSGLRVPSTLSQGTSDTINDCGPNQPQVEEALAWAQRWNTYAMFGTSQTYNNEEALTWMATHLEDTLGEVNRFDMAGIYDHYRNLRSLFRQDWTFNCLPADAPECAPTQPAINYDPTSETFTVCPAFYPLDLEDRVILLYAQFTRMIPQIRDDQREGYARLALIYKEVFFRTD